MLKMAPHRTELRTTQNGFRPQLLAGTKAKPIWKGMLADCPGVPQTEPKRGHLSPTWDYKTHDPITTGSQKVEQDAMSFKY